MLLSPECGGVSGQLHLADNKTVANINALRITKKYEGKGHMSALVRLMENYARERGYTHLTIGVEEQEKRNLAIYQHWGYCELIEQADEGWERVLYLKKL